MLYFILYLFIGLVGLLVTILLVALIFTRISPVFGQRPTVVQQKRYLKFPYFKAPRFNNIIKPLIDSTLPDYQQSHAPTNPNKRPKITLPVHKIDSKQLLKHPSKTRITWFGHSTLLFEFPKQLVLVDPMFSPYASPVQGVGSKRFQAELPLKLEDWPPVDTIVITHDHYDHLDYRSIKELKGKTKRFIVPAGVGAHLEKWGVSPSKIKEMGWWEELQLDGVKFIFTPTHHYSGRALNDRFHSLWGGWILDTTEERFFVSGDGGFGTHFKYIGTKYGPFDLAFIECGQYSRNWPQNHLFPPQSIQAALDVRAKIAMPIHWGSFALGFHDWNSPAERFTELALAQNLPVLVPEIGASFDLEQQPALSYWWRPLSILPDAMASGH